MASPDYRDPTEGPRTVPPTDPLAPGAAGGDPLMRDPALARDPARDNRSYMDRGSSTWVWIAAAVLIIIAIGVFWAYNPWGTSNTANAPANRPAATATAPGGGPATTGSTGTTAAPSGGAGTGSAAGGSTPGTPSPGR